MDNKNKDTGIGFIGLLTIVFVIAKILGFVNWSWWLVFMPIISLLAISMLLLTVAYTITKIKDMR